MPGLLPPGPLSFLTPQGATQHTPSPSFAQLSPSQWTLGGSVLELDLKNNFSAYRKQSGMMSSCGGQAKDGYLQGPWKILTQPGFAVNWLHTHPFRLLKLLVRKPVCWCFSCASQSLMGQPPPRHSLSKNAFHLVLCHPHPPIIN